PALAFLARPILTERLLPESKLVVHLLHSPHAFRDFLGGALGPPIVHAALQRDVAVQHDDLDVARIEIAVLGEALADVFANPFVGALIVARSASCMRAVRAEAARALTAPALIAGPVALAAPRAVAAGSGIGPKGAPVAALPRTPSFDVAALSVPVAIAGDALPVATIV